MRLVLAFCMAAIAIVASSARAQDSAQADRGFLTAFLEDNLSGAGRSVRIDGFAGALSSRATFKTMTIADAAGVWLTIADGALSWNRSALLSGRVEISELSAGGITMTRRPATDDRTGSWAATAGFSLPDLPVSVSIDKISAASVRLGAPVLGQEAAVSVSGALQLAGGEGSADLAIHRIDGREGDITFKGQFSNATQKLSVDLLAKEGQNGLAANLLGIPNRPPLLLALNGAGPVSDLALEVVLSSAEQTRISGTVAVTSRDTQVPGEPKQQFKLDLGGNLTPLLLPDYQAFFGTDVQLHALGTRTDTGRVELKTLSVSSAALRVDGALSLGADYVPERAALRLRLGLDGLKDVVLPLPGVATTVRDARLNLNYDQSQGPDWGFDGQISGLTRPGVSVTTLRLDGSGRLVRASSGSIKDSVGGAVSFVAGGIGLEDPALQQAIGPFLTGKVAVAWQAGQPVRLSNMAVTGQGYAASGNLELSGDLGIGGSVRGRFRDLSRLSGIAGTPLAGSAAVDVAGSHAITGGAFDAEATLTAQDLRTGHAAVDGLLTGMSAVRVSARRDGTGVTIRSLDVQAAGLTGSAEGHIGDMGADLTGNLVLPDLGLTRIGLKGRVAVTATATGPTDSLKVTVDGTGAGLKTGQVLADGVLAGDNRIRAVMKLTRQGFAIGSVDLTNTAVAVRASGNLDDTSLPISLSARLSDFALIAPQFPGPLTVTGTALPQAGGYRADLSAAGPGGTKARITGSADRLLETLDLHATGSLQTAIANVFVAPATLGGPAVFDLTLKGPPVLESVAGRVTVQGLRVAVPDQRVSLSDLSGDARLAGGKADLSLSGRFIGGGTIAVSGAVGLARPMQADLRVRLQAARLRDPQLFDTRVTGDLTVIGPLSGGASVAGALDLDATELRIPSTSFGASAFSGRIDHQNDPASARVTRARAGLSGTDRSAAAQPRSAPLSLDVTLRAPRRIFLRGRGLDAELGGQVRLRGTTADVTAIGQFDLVRGRLDLLGKRFDIDEGLVRLQGALVPYVRFVAATVTDGTAASITIEGQATEPAISFTSQPPLPEEEVVAQLLFGRGLQGLSAFQAAQLASAVASLTGRGGDGLVGRLRKSFGLDDFDVSTGADGNVALRAGKYLSDNVYTDVTVGRSGSTEIRLNLNVSPSVKVRGRASTDGSTGIGVYYERDY